MSCGVPNVYKYKCVFGCMYLCVHNYADMYVCMFVRVYMYVCVFVYAHTSTEKKPRFKCESGHLSPSLPLSLTLSLSLSNL
jgi:hypothetical protein